jgi:MYXO-CTERM domain-containing protein
MANKDALRVSGASGSVVIANNALYADKGNAIRVGGALGGVVVAGNVGVGGTQGVSAGFDASGDITADFVAADFLGGVPNDVFPAAGSALIGKAESAHLNDEDFNTTLRDGALDVGAYVFDAAGNPGWTLGAGFKVIADTSSGSGGAGGATGAGGSSSSSGETSGAGGSSPAAGSGGASSTASGGGSETVDSGCSVSGPSRGRTGAWLLLLGLAAFMRRRFSLGG